MATVHLRPQVAPKRILVVDADVLVGMTVQRYLAVDGHTVAMAKSAEEALSMLGNTEYDLVITDFQLAAMDGMELADAIRKQLPTMRVILITAYAERIDSRTGEVSNVDLVLGKPISLADLRGAIEKLF